jgi:hypothetical protein
MGEVNESISCLCKGLEMMFCYDFFLQNIDPARRRRRDVWGNNSTLGDPVRIYRTFRVITPDDLDEAVSASTVVNVGSG